jgi:probable non-F420 flavinoid oxidoreductase
MCSDHFQPWSERQGHSGFTWSWLGAALASTSMSFGTVCAPGQRYHPAIVAQAAATLAEMYPGRFWIAVGSGEALNESITGDPWPPKADRNARLGESVDLMRRLWSGETVTTRGHVVAVDARLHVRAAQPILIAGAALTPATAQWAGGWADALITVAQARDTMRAVIEAFREGGGEGKPMFLQVALSYAGSDAEARAAAHDQWRHCVVPPQQLADLTTPAAFDCACAAAREEDVAARVRVSADPERHLAWLHEDAAMGFERIYLHNVAREHQEQFIDMCATRLLPSFECPL